MEEEKKEVKCCFLYRFPLSTLQCSAVLWLSTCTDKALTAHEPERKEAPKSPDSCSSYAPLLFEAYRNVVIVVARKLNAYWS